jgi:2-haloacid dehalogenase
MPPTKAVVFDLYGTLYDVHSVARQCDASYPGRGMEISVLWRQKQLEYTWLRSLMGQYIPFEEATRDALVYTCQHLKVAPDLDPSTCATLCDAYLRLSPYPEVPDALRGLRDLGLPLAILSNGSAFSINSVVQTSGLQAYFTALLSVEAVGVFKPDFRVYRLACETLGLSAEEVLFVSSNAWDASGAYHFGFNVCWVNRDGKIFDQLGAKPHATVTGVDDVLTLIQRQ